MILEILSALAIVDTAGVVYLLWKTKKSVDVIPPYTDFRGTEPLAKPVKKAVECTVCKRRVVRHTLTPDGPVCANCKP
jgi:hypothetical protein